MADPILAVKDPQQVIADALAVYRSETGITLAPADPRRLHLQTLLLLLAQLRQGIDYSGKQSMVSFVDAGMPIESAVWIKALAALWGLSPNAPRPSTCNVRFTAATSGVLTIPANSRVTDGISIWETPNADGVSEVGAHYIDVIVTCTVPGDASNGVATGQIATLVDPIPGITSCTNTAYTSGGAPAETTEQFRTRLFSAPESTSTAGPRIAYEQLALSASPAVADCVCLGPDDAGEMTGPTPTAGNVWLLVIEGARDAAGNLTSVIPDPSGGVLTAVRNATTGEEVRPLGDHVTIKAPTFSNFDLVVGYYIARSRSKSSAAIQAAAGVAFAAYVLWQQSSIGRDVNPSQLVADLVSAGAKRVVVTSPDFAQLDRNVSARCVYQQLTFLGVEDD